MLAAKTLRRHGQWRCDLRRCPGARIVGLTVSAAAVP
jgi:hypothetical protein